MKPYGMTIGSHYTHEMRPRSGMIEHQGSPFGDVGIMVSHETVARVRRSLKKRARQADRAAVEESLD